jgi:hypothetical protein
LTNQSSRLVLLLGQRGSHLLFTRHFDNYVLSTLSAVLSRMNFLVPFQHLDKLLNPLCAGFWLLCSLKPIHNGVSIALVQGLEERFCFAVVIQLFQKIIRRGGVAR